MPLERLGSATTPDSVQRELHKALAQAICQHSFPYCDSCFNLVYPLVIPVARALLVAGMFERKNQNSGYVGIGQAFDALLAAVRESSGARR